ncbi:MAG: glycoside hydrolase family 9 protein [Bacteroidaceae bacterium]|nr:glycoside hydrolase family 9 protein [Bacteroidaceae bacterium]
MKKIALVAIGAITSYLTVQADAFKIGERGYFEKSGINVMAFQDTYPEGHQAGVCVIMNGTRIATNGDLRLEATPGQWQPLPKQNRRTVDGNSITTWLSYPDSSRHETGFNPMLYPDLQLSYSVRVEGVEDGVMVTVDLDKPVPKEFLGKVGFNFEFFPGILFGKPWIMDGKAGIYPQQPNGPVDTPVSNLEHIGDFHTGRGSRIDREHFLGDAEVFNPVRADDIISTPYAVGRKFTSRPDDNLCRLTVESLGETELKLYDGRMNHNNGWFVLRSEVPEGAVKGAIKWLIKPAVTESWMYKPVIQTSQVGYLPAQPKIAVIELDARAKDAEKRTCSLYRISDQGPVKVKDIVPQSWGSFLRYNYLHADFSDVTEEGLYQLRYEGSESPVFGISPDIYDRGVWQPVIEYFLPVQMCHMRVNEKYKVWHDACHMDDALMAPPYNHIDGYDQRPGLSKFNPLEKVKGVNIGGWHDAGDFDLRIESQAGESYILSLAYEAFHPDIDVTAIDQNRHICEIHQPDGKNDILQQVENGALTVINSWLALGRPYRGIICNSLRQYVLLGDAAAMTDGIIGNDDDRWIFTENNPGRAVSAAAGMAASYRVLKGFNDTLSIHCLDFAKAIYNEVADQSQPLGRGMRATDLTQLAAELYLATGEKVYRDYLVNNRENIIRGIQRNAWYLCRVAKQFGTFKRDKELQEWKDAFENALKNVPAGIQRQSSATPYGVPYQPSIWGAGWDIQSFGYQQYFLVSAYPEIFDMKPMLSALNFVLGCHPGSNQASFASGVGAQSATVGYGLNRADWSYIPGGVISGTAMIRPDFPELLTWPFLWQQTEYVLGGGSSHYMFLVLAAQQLCK